VADQRVDLSAGKLTALLRLREPLAACNLYGMSIECHIFVGEHESIDTARGRFLFAAVPHVGDIVEVPASAGAPQGAYRVKEVRHVATVSGIPSVSLIVK
jgi:hypothetical protein